VLPVALILSVFCMCWLLTPSNKVHPTVSSDATLAAQLRADGLVLAGVSRESDPPIEPYARYAAFTLIRGGAFEIDYQKYEERCKLLHAVLYNSDYGTPVPFDDIAFHEGNVPASIAANISARHRVVRFVDVRLYGGFKIPPKMQMWQVRKPAQYPIGYNHMCRFFAMQWVQALRRYDIAMRIDEDVWVHHVARNPFLRMIENNGTYGYALWTEEGHRETVLTMRLWMDEYIKSKQITPKQQVDVRWMYFTNVFITKVDWWLQPHVQRFLYDVDETQYIYHHRWGDAPLQTSALHLYSREEEIVFVELDYSHGSTRNEIKQGKQVKYDSTTAAGERLYSKIVEEVPL